MALFKGQDEAKILDLTVAKVKDANPAFEKADISSAAKSFFSKMVAADAYKPALKVKGSGYLIIVGQGGGRSRGMLAEERE